MVSINNSTGFVLPNNHTNPNSTKQNQGRGVESDAVNKSAANSVFADKVTAKTGVQSSDTTSSVKSTEQNSAISTVRANENRAVVTTPNAKNSVASAVELSVKAMKNADYQESQVQYDLPEGKSRKAMQEYFNVMSHDKREELSQMLGVDMYV